MKTIKTVALVEANTTNIQKTFKNIKQYAFDKGYQLKGNLTEESFLEKIKNFLGTNYLQFESKTQAKTCRKYLTKLENKLSIREINRFLNFLYKKVYKIETDIPYLTYSETELKIKESKKLWKQHSLETEKLRLEYKKLKGDFYKK
jgi:hypothetical protein